MSFDTSQDLLGHRAERITTHYSAAELSRLVQAAESVCDVQGEKAGLVVFARPGMARAKILALECQATACRGVSPSSPWNERNRQYIIRNMITENGAPRARDAVCSAFRPPA